MIKLFAERTKKNWRRE